MTQSISKIESSLIPNLVIGISFCGADIGGFEGDPEEELFVRWFQAAAYQPFFRNHASAGTAKREPYLFNAPALNIIREATRKRYALLPLWYTMFYEHERFGTPIMRPMLMNYPLDKTVFALDDQYMLSDKLLVRPVMVKGATNVTVKFPSTGDRTGDFWYDTDGYNKIESLGAYTIDVNIEKTPVYQRGGTVIPKKETIKKSTAYMGSDPISLYVAVDQKHQAKGTLYIDDEKSFEYREKKYLYLQYEFTEKTLSSKRIDKDADFVTESKINKIVIAGFKPNEIPDYATLKSTNGESRLEIVEFNLNYFVIANPDVSVRDEWTIVLNGAKQNVFSVTLLIATLLLLVKNFF